MNRNTSSPFAEAPQIHIDRTNFTIEHDVKTSFNAGQLIPFYVDEVLPGQTDNIETNSVIRMTTQIKPAMDVAYADTYWFYVPCRILWEHWKEFQGENTTAPWTQTITYTIPQIKTTSNATVQTGTIADYFGIPTGVANLSVNALPFRAMVKIYNEWFRDQNWIAPATERMDDTDQTYDATDPTLGGVPFKIAKGHDYFTSLLPQPQKHAPVSIPLGTTAPVYGYDNTNAPTSEDAWLLTGIRNILNPTINWNSLNKTNTGANQNIQGTSTLAGNIRIASINDLKSYNDDQTLESAKRNTVGLYTDLTTATAATINALRLAFQTQKLFERESNGTRYREILKNRWGVESPVLNAVLQVPEYLGGTRFEITAEEVLQTSETSSTGTAQGNVAGMSRTNNQNNDFVKSYIEHGYVIGLIAVRQLHTYQQGLNRMWTKKEKLEFYQPEYAMIGEQPAYKYELYADGTSTDNEVLGYHEAWAEYRFKPSIITGQMRSTYAQSLDVWHYGDDYATRPTMGQTFIEETADYIDRTLAVSSNVSDQFIADIFIENHATKPMPFHSVPGYIDHF